MATTNHGFPAAALDVERCALRPGNVHSADDWRTVLEPVIGRYRGVIKRLYFRGGAAFANPEIYEVLEAEGAGYTVRLPANNVLQRKIGYLLKRPVGRPPHEVRRYYASFSYQAQSWNKPQRGQRGKPRRRCLAALGVGDSPPQCRRFRNPGTQC